MQEVLSVILGIGLSAACGFRVFVPLLVLSIAARAGFLTLGSGFQWIGTWPALLAFTVATVLEIGAYYIPWLDHVLDLVTTPAAVVAGTLVMASTITGMDPLLRWSLAIIAGGGAAGAVQAMTGITRLASTATTGGCCLPATWDGRISPSCAIPCRSPPRTTSSRRAPTAIGCIPRWTT